LLKSEFPSWWEDARVEFIFSVPTTWKVNPTVERFRKIISMAGFGRHPTHTAVIGLTEAEAAAVHTAKDTPAIFRVSDRRARDKFITDTTRQENEILLVCDVGGGTTVSFKSKPLPYQDWLIVLGLVSLPRNGYTGVYQLSQTRTD
jgi:hypothetical protein